MNIAFYIIGGVSEMKNTCPVPKGVLLIIGGKEDKGEDKTEKKQPDTYVPQEILHAFYDLIGKRNPHRKFVLAGTSAGAMAMSTPMIYAGNQEVHDIAGKIKITTGLEFLKDVCIDTHFENRNRFIRLAQVIATNPTCIGVGLSENTAVIVREGVDMGVIGSGMATIIEGFHITDANYESYTENLLVSIRDIKVHLISKGDKFRVKQMNPHHA